MVILNLDEAWKISHVERSKAGQGKINQKQEKFSHLTPITFKSSFLATWSNVFAEVGATPNFSPILT